ncbi:endonuclease domain-containing protein [bacterium]|nr:endonuclease domain-containing protein [bacterium]
MKKLVTLARNLRKNATPQEATMWNLLRLHKFFGLEFRRQYPIGDYIVDFICREKKIIIEIDGGHHAELDNYIHDEVRTQLLESKGFKVVRFWNSEIDSNIDGVYERLMNECGISGK